jgi:hypothetical protein
MVTTDRELEAYFRSLASLGFCSGGKQCYSLYKNTLKKRLGKIWRDIY